MTKPIKSLPIPHTDQIRALLEGRVYQLLKDYVAERVYDCKPYLTVERRDIIEYLRAHPEAALGCFNRNKEQRKHVLHDIARIEEYGEAYRVYWLDHGKPHSVQTFPRLAEALAEFVMIDVGKH
ncbi:MAG: hypothetical protein ABSD58_17635 [Verrucomicrobiia bacterium]|jgi:hypothetical protein